VHVECATVRRLLVPLTIGVMLAAAVPASAQAPVVTVKPAAGQTITQLITSGFTYRVSSNSEVNFSAKLTLRRHGRTIALTKSVRAETNYGQSADPVEYSLPYAGDSAAAILRKYKKSVSVTLTVKVTGAGGYRGTLVKTAKLAKG